MTTTSDLVNALEDVSPLDTIKETTVSRDEAENSAKNSLDFLAALAMPLVFKYLFQVYLNLSGIG